MVVKKCLIRSITLVTSDDVELLTIDENHVDSCGPDSCLSCLFYSYYTSGRKSYIRTPTKLASTVVYPFAFIKPCGVHGDVTLNDINQRIHNPPKPKPNEEDPSVSYPTSAFSGKPVVGKTKIRTEGGKGSITIMRTKG